MVSSIRKDVQSQSQRFDIRYSATYFAKNYPNIFCYLLCTRHDHCCVLQCFLQLIATYVHDCKKCVTISEPGCGAGGMMIAAAVEMQALGYEPSQHMWVSCVDNDVVAVSMAYIQLSSLGIPGEIVLGNALANERRLVMYTPMHWLGDWSLRILQYHSEN